MNQKQILAKIVECDHFTAYPFDQNGLHYVELLHYGATFHPYTKTLDLAITRMTERGLVQFTGYEYVLTAKGRAQCHVSPNETRKRAALQSFMTEYQQYAECERAYAHDSRHEYRALSWENRIRYETYLQAAEIELAKLDFANVPFIIPD